jgi:hypothetical protein
MPFVDRDKNRRLDAATSQDLRAFLDRCVQQLAETRFRFMYLPRRHVAPLPRMI